VEPDPDYGAFIGDPQMPGDQNPTGWWEVIGGAWRWVTDPTPNR
jgi:hypothetical protein